MYDEITAVYSRHNRELTLSIFDQNNNLIVSSKMPKLISYKKGEMVKGINNEDYIVIEVQDNAFNPRKLHSAKMIKKSLYLMPETEMPKDFHPNETAYQEERV